MKVDPKHIGHIAPSFDDPKIYNTFVIKPAYRISLRMSEVEKLFPWPIDSTPGRLARLQVLGLFYWPLNHRVAAGSATDPDTGIKRKPDVPSAKLAENQEAYKVAWKYFKEKFCGVAKNTLDANTEAENDKGEAELKKRLEEWIVQKSNGTGPGSSYNTGAATNGGGELPLAAPNDESEPEKKETDGHYAKIRLPGGWTHMSKGKASEYAADQTVSGMKMYDPRHEYESNCYKVNPVLGKIPLIAKVEKLDPITNEWKAAPNVRVHFQLIKPYKLPAFDEVRAKNNTRLCHQQLNCPTLVGSSFSATDPTPNSYSSGVGPKYVTEEWEKYEKNDDNPQANNCHVDCGGKRKSGNPEDGTDVVVTNQADKQGLKNTFWVGDYPGFTKTHDAPPAGIHNFKPNSNIPLPPRSFDEAPKLKPTEAVTDTDYPHSVKAQTNDDGEAGVIFMPSRCGGDRYRLRAYLADDGEGFTSKGNDFDAVRVDTGTFVVWRNMRLSRWAKMGIVENTMLNNAVCKLMGHEYSESTSGSYHSTKDTISQHRMKRWGRTLSVFGFDAPKAWAGLPPWSLDRLGDGSINSDFEGLRPALARGFCELDTDTGYNTDITQDEWKTAVDQGYEDTWRFQKYFTTNNDIKDVHIDVLFFRQGPGDPGNPGTLANDVWKQITDGISVQQSFCCPTRGSKAFDAVKTARHGGGNILTLGADTYRTAVSSMIDSYFLPGFARGLSQNGFIPGSTFIQGLACSSIEVESNDYWCGGLGFAMPSNSAYVVYGRANYREKIGIQHEISKIRGTNHNSQKTAICGYMSTVIHELGHCLFKVHALGLDGGGNPAGGALGNRHDCWGHLTTETLNPKGKPLGQPRYGTCLMSYRNCEGMYCARCLFELRGWDILNAKMTVKGADKIPPNAVIATTAVMGPHVAVPAAPANLKATPGDKQVHLTWEKAANTQSYKVLRGTATGTHVQIKDNLSSLSYTDNDNTLVNGTTYYYVVMAVNSAGDSPKSNEVNVKPNALPDAPQNLQGAAQAGPKVELTWNAVAGAGANDYNIRYAFQSGKYDNKPITSKSSPHTINLSDGGTFFFVVTAVVGGAESKHSNEVSLTFAPAKPTSVAAAAGDKQATLTWKAVSGADSYEIKRSTTAGEPYEDTLTAGQHSTSYTDTGLTNNTRYYYVIRAENSGGKSDKSTEVNAQPHI